MSKKKKIYPSTFTFYKPVTKLSESAVFVGGELQERVYNKKPKPVPKPVECACVIM